MRLCDVKDQAGSNAKNMKGWGGGWGASFHRQVGHALVDRSTPLYVRSDGGPGTALTESVCPCLTVTFNAVCFHYRKEHQPLSVFGRPSSLEDM